LWTAPSAQTAAPASDAAAAPPSATPTDETPATTP
jgi:hypothetical protein